MVFPNGRGRRRWGRGEGTGERRRNWEAEERQGSGGGTEESDTTRKRNYHLEEKRIMPKRNIIQVQLPAEQPDCCAMCPLLGLVPKYVARPKNSKETHVCLGTMEALTQRGTRIRASQRDSHHPLKRPCDHRWPMWMTLPQRKLGLSIETYRECRVPYEATLQLTIKFHR